ncbi:hypothetical protein RN001_005249 [Aquatica leii]|uniref:MADF domain-containing protein n=1 Tax=Aquatica leii TaxID=1421715 RepID=A0AAN7Q6H4_9COLE|nr:hypothetical protein RN001_005249 [Aquatica leii]
MSEEMSNEVLDEDKSEKNDIRNVPKGILKEFIEAYRLHTALWQIKNKQVYNNRNLKIKGYKELTKIWKKYDADADEKTVKLKMQSLRGSFRKELKKVEKSQRSGSGVDDLYTSHLWYFNLLMFLTDHELPTTSIDNIEDLTQELELEVDNNKDMLDGEGNNSIPSQRNINNEVRKEENASLVDASRINKRGGSDEKRGPSKIKKMKIEKNKYFLSHAQMRFNRNLQKAKP